MDLETPLKSLGFVYKVNANRLERLGIYTLRDLLFHIPQRYENLSLVSKIGILQAGELVTIQGKVTEIKNVYTKRRFQLQKAYVEDDTGAVECMWFNQPYITRSIHKGNFVSIAGRVEEGTHPLIKVKEYEVLPFENASAIHTGRLVPVYSETKGLTSKWIRNRITDLLSQLPDNLEYLPASVKSKNNLLDLTTALQSIHFPKNLQEVEEARKRLAFDELFLMQLTGLQKRKEWQRVRETQAFAITPHQKNIEEFWEALPFELTNAQKRAVHEIFQDLQNTKPMNRLLEGDVGSGKTVVAAIALYLAHLNGFQGVFMAPTSILAQQHFKTISQLLSPFGVRIKLLLGGKKGKSNSNEKKGAEIKTGKALSSSEKLTPDSFDILIGTHAILESHVTFSHLGLVVIDEQQRFGVEQRGILRQKGNNPHVLTMTATPIPRTVFLTMYGDLDLSVLDEMPKGRKIVKTWFVPKVKREAAYEWIKKNIREGKRENKNQVFIVCPFIEESETLTTVKAATKEFEELKTHVFSEFSLGLLHGKMKVTQKQEVLASFQRQEFDILVTTPVVEVGIDIPNATIIVIEAAERFGLAQLHQLRGRVGRSDKSSFCLLFADRANDQIISRLKLLERNYQGAELAELDLKLRGPGDMYGTMQHGSRNLKVASFSDFDLIEKTKKDAENIFQTIEQYPELFQKLKETNVEKVSPD